MTTYLWRVTLSHDGGTVRLVTAAATAERAAELVCKVELAPRSAVLSVESVSTTIER